MILVPKSHTTFTPSETNVRKDWIQVASNKTPEEAVKILRPGVKLLIPGNSFVLWNSKTIHANTGMKSKEISLNRLTAYITLVPKSRRVNEAQFEKRKETYKQGHTTSHWPDKIEIKKYPWGFGPRYESKQFGIITPTLENGDIPLNRLSLI